MTHVNNMALAAVPIRTAKQIEGIRRACRLGREVLDKAHAAIRPGVTTDEIDRVVSALLRHSVAGLNNFVLLHSGQLNCYTIAGA